MNMDLPVLSSSFFGRDHYRARVGTEYALLPFRFLSLDCNRVIVTNLVGEHIVLPRDVLHSFARHQLDIDSNIYNQLKAKHFLLDGDSSVALDLLACKFRTKHSLLKNLTSLFIVVVSLRCEHSCPYCQVSRQSQDRQAYDLQVTHAERAIDFVFSSPSPDLKIEFQGGEPLLNFEMIRWIVESATRRNAIERRNLAFVIATNLALVTSEILDFCAEYNIAISTSLDGPRELHNRNRPRPGGDSYERAIEGIARVRERLGADAVSALMTTTAASLSQPEAIIDEYVSQGFRSIFLRSVSPYGFATKTGLAFDYSVEEWLAFYRRALDYIIHLNVSGTYLREDYTSILLQKILTPFPTGYVDLQSPAGLGVGCIAFNYDGSIYASDEARMLAEMGDHTFRLGHLDSDTFESVVTSDALVRMLSETMTEGMPMCSDCGIQPYCGSDPVYHYSSQGDVVGFKPSSGFCRKNMEMVKHIVMLLEDDQDSARILRSWISQVI